MMEMFFSPDFVEKLVDVPIGTSDLILPASALSFSIISINLFFYFLWSKPIKGKSFIEEYLGKRDNKNTNFPLDRGDGPNFQLMFDEGTNWIEPIRMNCGDVLQREGHKLTSRTNEMKHLFSSDVARTLRHEMLPSTKQLETGDN